MKTQRFFIIALFFLFAGTLMATSPKKVELKLDRETGALTVTVVHPSKNMERHYIDEIVVEVNGTEVILEEYEEQEAKKEFQAIFVLKDLEKGDKIKVIAKCNQFGRKSEKLTVE
ncbi:MAG: hypothetical protein R6T99_02380 [Bacteroidales bacterium]